MRITIRQSITTLVITAILLLSTSLILITQYTFNKFLVKFVASFIQKANFEIKTKVSDYLQPLNSNLFIMSHLIQQGAITPQLQGFYKSYLFQIMQNNLQIQDIMWATPQGEMISFLRTTNNKLYLQHFFLKDNQWLYYFAAVSDSGVVGTFQKISNTHFDPRTRPWYQQAVEKKQVVWTKFYNFSSYPKLHNEGNFVGFTAAIPIYKNNNLLGVFAMDISMSRLAEFIKAIDITPNSTILIFNHQNEIVVIKEKTNTTHFISKKITPEIFDQLGIPFNLIHYLINESPSNQVSTFKGKKHQYLLAYKIVPNITNLDWHIALLIPVVDILGPLKKQGMIALGTTFLIVILGLIIAEYLARKISRPISQLAKEAKAVQDLNFEKRFEIKSNIIEINSMVHAFHAMEKGLKSFESYVPTDLVKKLLSSGKIAALGGESKILSVLFCDIEGFTSIAESMVSDQLIYFVSLFLQEMTQIILCDSGTVDKYIGDAIVAFWNAPIKDDQHALHCCHAALSMVHYLENVLNPNLQKQGYPAIKIRIGINTGRTIVGNVGSKERLSYTAIGDNVNLASRLQEINKIYATRLIVSEYTYQHVQTHFSFRLLDRVAVRGKTKGIYIYELLGASQDQLSFDFKKYNSIFLEAFNYYQRGHWSKAIDLFQQLLIIFPNDHLATMYVDRCYYLMDENPKEWNGVWVMYR